LRPWLDLDAIFQHENMFAGSLIVRLPLFIHGRTNLGVSKRGPKRNRKKLSELLLTNLRKFRQIDEDV
jgi:hypothetical protein